jgi:hypothetical protein
MERPKTLVRETGAPGDPSCERVHPVGMTGRYGGRLRLPALHRGVFRKLWPEPNPVGS